MFSNTVMCGYSAWFWNTMAMSRSLGATLLITSPSIEIVPDGDFLQPRNQPQRRRFAAAGRPHQHQQFLVLHLRQARSTARMLSPPGPLKVFVRFSMTTRAMLLCFNGTRRLSSAE